MTLQDLPYLLLIQVERAEGRVRDALRLADSELGLVLEIAGASRASLAILTTDDCLALISTEADHRRAFAPVLSVLRERSQHIAGLGALRVRGLRGGDAARWVVRQSSGLDGAGQHDFICALHGAAALAARAGALSDTLKDLTRLAERARARVQSETRLAHAGSSSAEIEIEQFAAQRIAEEEIVAWQSSAPEVRSSSLRVPALGEYGTEEAESSIRLRVARVLDRLDKPGKLGVA